MNTTFPQVMSELQRSTRRMLPDARLVRACADYQALLEGGAYAAGAEAEHLLTIAAEPVKGLFGLYEKAAVALEVVDRFGKSLSAFCRYQIREALKSAMAADEWTTATRWKEIAAEAQCAESTLHTDGWPLGAPCHQLVASALRGVRAAKMAVQGPQMQGGRA